MSDYLTDESGEPLGLEQSGLVEAGALQAEDYAPTPAVDPADALQAGIFALLTADATLTGLVSGVYDDVPEDVEPDYVVLGEMTSGADGTHSAEGRETAVTLHTWTRADSFKTANAIGARLVALLWHRHADLNALTEGHDVWRVEHEFAQTLKDPQPGIRHRVDRFRVWSSQEA